MTEAPPDDTSLHEITGVGAEGDGVAAGAAGRKLFIPLTLPGEAVRATPARRSGFADLEALLRASPDRVAPPCPHFGVCGGCALQHWSDPAYAAWKRGRLVEALARAGFPDAPVAALHRTAPGRRRRADLALRRGPGGIAIGFHGRDDGAVVDLAVCPVLHPRLVALVAPLRALLTGLPALRRDGSALLNLLDTGPDLLLRTDGVLDAPGRTRLARFAATEGLARIAWARGDEAPEIAAQLAPATLRLDGVDVAPPPGAFLQASSEGEAAIIGATLAGLPAKLPARPLIIELYAGIGTLTLPLSARARVTAFEGAAGAVTALAAAAGRAGRPIMAVRRDLARQPLLAREVAGAAAVVLDPPFAGAAGQLAALALASPRRIILVSCNPAALARDAAPLARAGWAVVAATPIDQFLWSPHLEAVVVFERRP